MIKSAVTICQVPQAASGPFVFHQPLEAAVAEAAATGFDAVELFLTGPDQYPSDDILDLIRRHRLAVAALGTGAGAVVHGLTLTSPDPAVRAAARDFILSVIRLGGALNAPAILGSMQGRHGGDVPRDLALEWLADALADFSAAAASYDLPFIYEPLNRYESNLLNTLESAADWLDAHAPGNIAILADMFHMNIEEANPAVAITTAARRIGHVHYADSNRRAMGFGHTDPAPLVLALVNAGYTGYLSAEVLPLPTAAAAARQTLLSIKQYLP